MKYIVIYTARNGQVYPYNFDLCIDECRCRDWVQRFPELSAAEYALLSAMNLAYWNVPEIGVAFCDHIQDKANYVVREIQ